MNSCTTHSCGAHAACTDTGSGPSCTCNAGYAGDGHTCIVEVQVGSNSTAGGGLFCQEINGKIECEWLNGGTGSVVNVLTIFAVLVVLILTL